MKFAHPCSNLIGGRPFLNIPEYLNLLKTRQNLSWQDVANLTNTPIATLRNIFSGETVNPGFTTLCQIIYGLGGSVDELYGKSAPPSDARLAEAYEERINCIKAEHQEHVDKINQFHEVEFKALQESFNKQTAELKEMRETSDKRMRFVLIITAALIVVLDFIGNFIGR
jgi:transcriptional regulator with XRE-family HTH domain